MKTDPLIYNIPAGHCFADSLALGILERAAADPLKLSDCVVLLPSRRACRTLRDAFLKLSGGNALLLPRLQPIGDVDADEVALLLAGEEDMDAEDFFDVPPAVSRLERQLLLARMILKAGTAQSFDQAAALSLELGKFLDEVQTERLAFSGLSNLVPEEFAGHWQRTLDFLKILTENWPAILGERGVIDYAARRNLLLESQIKAWQKNPPPYQVIAAGSTGTVPAARELLALVAKLPRGSIVLPGLDVGMDDNSWSKLGEDHPQYNMKKLLGTLQAERSDVIEWALEKKPVVNEGRVRLLSEAMRPADTTDHWRKLTPQDIPSQALHGFSRIDCATPQEEADIIALILRETLKDPGKTAALITPDRRLARRVTLSMRRWGIQIDDSGGQPLTELPAGAWLMLTAEAAEEGLAPVTLLSLLKHPLMAAAMPADELRDMVYMLDKLALRGPRPSSGFAGLRNAIAAINDERFKGSGKKLLAWLEKIETVMRPFVELMAERREIPFNQLIETHIALAEKLAETTEMAGDKRLWTAEAGEAASDYLHQLLAAAADVPPLSPEHYVSLLSTLLKSVTVRPHFGSHPRLSILGQIEARLYCADRVILGGLNEGTWPDLPAHDPWMSRPMRRQFGLPSPEKTISLAAHDFVQAASATEVFVTRAQKVDGTPTVPARWLLRMEAVLSAVGLEMPQRDAILYRQWLKDLDKPAAPPKAAPRPAPTPPVEARPRKLSVTRIESWMRDPYQIYAQYILKLSALDPVDADPGGAERGTFIHAALEKFIREFPVDVPPDAVDRLLAFGRAALLDMRIPQEVEAFWWPRFEKIAVQFVDEERSWREEAKPYRTEISGEWQFEGANEPFTLTGKADRIDKYADGSYAVIDYKSGFTPSNTDVKQGLSPQLPLEALMIEKGAFGDIPPDDVNALIYWKVTGSGQKPVERKSILPRNTTVQEMVSAAEAGLRDLVAKFDDPATPYLSQPSAESKARFSDFDHLARVKEWGISGDEEDDAA